mmetsp:Transcript_11960/g.33673  ORF Transcript_11960/g.33673 Transcript_11960/m.33673 type:complete len:220 (+) Transcript_11960:5334-5993(+)
MRRWCAFTLRKKRRYMRKPSTDIVAKSRLAILAENKCSVTSTLNAGNLVTAGPYGSTSRYEYCTVSSHWYARSECSALRMLSHRRSACGMEIMRSDCVRINTRKSRRAWTAACDSASFRSRASSRRMQSTIPCSLSSWQIVCGISSLLKLRMMRVRSESETSTRTPPRRFAMQRRMNSSRWPGYPARSFSKWSHASLITALDPRSPGSLDRSCQKMSRP